MHLGMNNRSLQSKFCRLKELNLQANFFSNGLFLNMLIVYFELQEVYPKLVWTENILTHFETS